MSAMVGGRGTTVSGLELARLPRLGYGRILTFSLGWFAFTLLLRTVAGYLQITLIPPDAGEMAGGESANLVVTLFVFTLMYALGRVFIDAFSDPAVGYLSDITKSRWGRRKPYMLAGGVLLCVAFVMLFSLAPGLSWQNTVLFIVGINLFFVALTLWSIPYQAMVAEISPHPDDRRRLTTVMAVMVVFGVILGQALAPVFFNLIGLKWTILSFAGLALVSFGVTVFVFRAPAGVETPPAAEPLPIKTALRTTLRFKPFVGFIGGFIALHSVFVLLTTALPYLAKSILVELNADVIQARTTYAEGLAERERLAEETRAFEQREEPLPAELDAEVSAVRTALRPFDDLHTKRANTLTFMLMGAVIGSTLFLGIPLVNWSLRRIGKRKTGLWCIWLFAVAPLAMPLVGLPGLEGIALPLALVIGVAAGIPLGGIFILDNLLLSDVVDMDYAITGQPRESFYFGIYGLLMKGGIALAMGISGGLFMAFGYSRGDDWGIRLTGPASFVLMAIGGLIYRMYPETRETGIPVRPMQHREASPEPEPRP